jgi:hypothetical protein
VIQFIEKLWNRLAMRGVLQ